jgi:glucose/arabinose dehydrogenase
MFLPAFKLLKEDFMSGKFSWIILSLFATAASAQSVVDAQLTITPSVTGLQVPTQIRFLGADDLLITEKNTGRVLRSQNGVLSTVLDLNVANNSERGLLGLTLDPDFASNGRVYGYYSVSSGGDGDPWVENRLSQFTWNGNTLGNEVPLQTFGRASDGLADGPNHDAGPILFGPDGRLYGTTGDLNRRRAEQNILSEAAASAGVGGIYRLNADGSVPADNPFVAAANPDFHRWYAYGVRNSYGIAFDPLTGHLWNTENGPDRYDEINLVAPGFNSGWTQIMGPDARDPQGEGDLVQLPGSAYSDPEFSFRTPIAITGLAFLANSALDASYRDALLVGDANHGNLYLFRLNAARDGFVLGGPLDDLVADDLAERNARRFGQDFGGIADIQIGPDGDIYVASLGRGTVYRLSAPSNRVPEPATHLLWAAGGLALLLSGHRRCRRLPQRPLRL